MGRGEGREGERNGRRGAGEFIDLYDSAFVLLLVDMIEFMHFEK